MDRDVDIKVLNVKCEKSVIVINMKFYQFVGQTVGVGGVV